MRKGCAQRSSPWSSSVGAFHSEGRSIRSEISVQCRIYWLQQGNSSLWSSSACASSSRKARFQANR